MATDQERLEQLRAEEQKAQFKTYFKESMAEFLAEQKEVKEKEPEEEPPTRTHKKPEGFLGSLFS